MSMIHKFKKSNMRHLFYRKLVETVYIGKGVTEGWIHLSEYPKNEGRGTCILIFT